MIRVFKRCWWKQNAKWPDGLEPSPGRKRTIAFVETEDQARVLAQAWNATHRPGRYSLKAEFENA